MIYILILLGILFIEQMYKRYVPMKGIDFREIDTIDRKEDIILLDIRDYQEAAKDSIPDSINIPFAYLKRFYREIPNKKIHLIASNCMEKNIGARYLKKYGFSVQSYTVKEKKCKNTVASVFN